MHKFHSQLQEKCRKSPYPPPWLILIFMAFFVAWAKTDVAMVNEVLCKIICHNICCLIQESHELGIDTTFWAENSPAQKVGVN
jgi:hypothetical protein